VEGVIRILTTLALAIALALGTPAAARAATSAAARTMPAAVAPTPSPGATPAPSATSSGDLRIGGTPGQSEPGKPGWVWWIGAAMVVAFGAGGLRFWRNRWLENPDADNPTD
jgi:hypothetical protein